jgi:hypothetical protein
LQHFTGQMKYRPHLRRRARVANLNCPLQFIPVWIRQQMNPILTGLVKAWARADTEANLLQSWTWAEWLHFQRTVVRKQSSSHFRAVEHVGMTYYMSQHNNQREDTTQKCCQSYPAVLGELQLEVRRLSRHQDKHRVRVFASFGVGFKQMVGCVSILSQAVNPFQTKTALIV